MKIKFFCLVGGLLTALGLCGCGQLRESSSKNSSEENTTQNAKAISGAYKNAVINNGIGRSVNAITDNFAEISSQYKNVFDAAALSNMTMIKTQLNQQEASSYISSSMKDFIVSINGSYSTNQEVQASYQLFTTDAYKRYKMDASFDYTSETRQVYYTLSQNILANRIDIDEYQDTDKLRSALSASFLSDANAVENGILSAKDFLAKYGTHVVLSAYFGGKIQCDYYVAANNASVDLSALYSYKEKISGLLSYVINGGADKDESLDISAKLNFTANNKIESFHAKAWGGPSIPMATEAQFSANFPTWVSSFNQNDDFTALTDFPKNSLLNVWTLLPTTYSKAKTALKSEFDQEAATAYTDFLSKYTISNETFTSKRFSPAVQSCATDNGYDTDSPNNDSVAKNEIRPRVADYFINDVAWDDKGIYKRGYFGFRIDMITSQNPGDIERTGISGSSANGSKLNNDDYLVKNVKGTTTTLSDDAKIGYGCSFVDVYYADGTVQSLTKNNLFSSVHQEGYPVTILEESQLKANAKISRIMLSFVYEIATTWQSGWIYGTAYTNWRMQTFLNFR